MDNCIADPWGFSNKDEIIMWQKKKKREKKRDYSNQNVRLKSFKGWQLKFVRPDNLAAASFYYKPFDEFYCPWSLLRESPTVSNNVQCFCCRIQLMEWKESDDGITEHKKWSP